MPNVPQDIGDTIANLERRIRDLEGRVNIRPAQNVISSGDVQVQGGGAFKMMSVDGSQVQFWVGRILPNHLDGSEQRGFIIYREDGSMAFSLYTADNNPQALALRDKGNTTVLADDVVSGGLARPYLSTEGWFGATEVPAYTTNSATFVTLQNLPWIKQHPKVNSYFLVKADAATTGEIRLVDDSNVVIAGPLSVSAGAYTFGSATGPLAGALYSATYLHWQARVTSGAGSIGVKGLSTFGVQS